MWRNSPSETHRFRKQALSICDANWFQRILLCIKVCARIFFNGLFAKLKSKPLEAPVTVLLDSCILFRDPINVEIMRAFLPTRGALSKILTKISWLGVPHDLGVPPLTLTQRPRHRPVWRLSGVTFASSSVKRAIVYKCTECGEHSPQWKGRCPSCSGWNT
jgi:hypothetical protein